MKSLRVWAIAVAMCCGAAAQAATPIYQEDFTSAWNTYSSDGSTPFLSNAHGDWYLEPLGYVHGAIPADDEVWLDYQGLGETTPKLTFSFVTASALSNVTVTWDGYFCDGCAKTPSDTAVSFLVTGTGGTLAAGIVNGEHKPYTLGLGNLAAGTYTFNWDPQGTSNYRFDNFAISAVPEPETAVMLLAGLVVIGAQRRRRASV